MGRQIDFDELLRIPIQSLSLTELRAHERALDSTISGLLDLDQYGTMGGYGRPLSGTESSRVNRLLKSLGERHKETFSLIDDREKEEWEELDDSTDDTGSKIDPAAS